MLSSKKMDWAYSRALKNCKANTAFSANNENHLHRMQKKATKHIRTTI